LPIIPFRTIFASVYCVNILPKAYDSKGYVKSKKDTPDGDVLFCQTMTKCTSPLLLEAKKSKKYTPDGDVLF